MHSSFVTFSLPWFAIGFLALCFWWRWWLLLPAGVAALVFGALQYRDVTHADGPGVVFGVIIVVFLCIGAASGFLASGLVVVGRVARWKTLRAGIVLPVLFVGGFASFFVFTLASQELREVRYSAPAASCLDQVHDVRLGDTTLAIPISPAILVYGPDKYRDHYVLWSNPDAKAFCSLTDGDAPPVSEIAFKLDGFPQSQKLQTQHPFCQRKHAEYIWAEMGCSLTSPDAMPDIPVRVNIAVVDPISDPITLERAAMAKYPTSTQEDGLTIHSGKYDQYIERKDGYFAHCHHIKSPGEKRLYCMAKARLPGNLMLSYDFLTTQAAFAQKSAVVAGNAKAILSSLKH